MLQAFPGTYLLLPYPGQVTVLCVAFLFVLFSFSKLTSRGNKPSIRSIVVFILESGSKMSARDLSWWTISLARASVRMSSEDF